MKNRIFSLKMLVLHYAMKLYRFMASTYRKRLTAFGDPKRVFSNIYKHNIWGNKKGFFSGKGSHDPVIVEPYIKNVSSWIKSLPNKPVLVDLGCGDFNIGSQLVGETKSYIACDIVPELITHHRSKYLNSNLQFFEVNMINDVLPEGEVVTIRQVLQHLNNKQIGQVIPKLAKYKYLILTEHLPNGEFEPNKDKDTGPDIRTAINSGVVLTSPPFNLKTKETKILCEVKLPKGNIQTVLYTM